jgi:hypothetical protein
MEWVEPAEISAIGTVHRLGAMDGLAAEVQPDRLVTQLGEQGSLMTSAAARNQYSARWLGCSAVSAQNGLQRRRWLALLPTITALAVALVPVRYGHSTNSSSRAFKRHLVGGRFSTGYGSQFLTPRPACRLSGCGSLVARTSTWAWMWGYSERNVPSCSRSP